MAKPKYEYWLTPEGLALLAGWARDGLTDEQIAYNMGISRKTLAEWKKTYGDIGDTLKKGKDIADYLVENALFQNALAGNTTAQIFWLKNRKPSLWRDSVKAESDKEEQQARIALLKAKADAGRNDKEDKLDKLFEQIEGALKDVE